MKQRKISKTNVVNFSTYLGMVIFSFVMTALSKAGVLNRSMTGLLVPICCYMSMAVSLNLTVGILGELTLGHAGFMSVGAFTGVIASQSLTPSPLCPCVWLCNGDRRRICRHCRRADRHPRVAAQGRLSGHCDAGFRRDHQEYFQLPLSWAWMQTGFMQACSP